MSLPAFGVRRPVPVNLLMMALLIAGLASGWTLRREFFPESDPEQAIITLQYPGASPEQIEQTLAIKVEDKLAELDEIDQITTTLSENGGGITAELREGADPEAALEDIERAIDSLTDLPDQAEEIEARLLEHKIPVIQVIAHGDIDEGALKRTARQIRDDLRSLPGMGDAVVGGVRAYEIRVDVQETALLEHGLALTDVADTIGAWMADLPGGTVRGEAGDVKVRTVGVPERAEAIEGIVLRASEEGGAVRVRDVARVQDGFADDQLIYRFNGRPAANITVFKVGKQDIVALAETVRAYVDGRRGQPFGGTVIDRYFGRPRYQAWQRGAVPREPLPAGVSLALSSDFARFVEGRLNLLLRNAGYGAILVFMTLLAFLNWRVAFWVGVGLLTALLGTLVLMQAMGVTLNLLTMFGLIVVLGLLVDDAIVVSENVQARHDGGEPALLAAVRGTEQVAWPVVATVLTSVVAFLPLSFIRGRIGDLLGALPMVVACALLMSLIESLLILPSHMGHSLRKRDHSEPLGITKKLRQLEAWRDHWVMERLVPAYGRFLDLTLRFRYVTITATLVAVILAAGLVAGGRVVYNFLPGSDAETIVVDVRMPVGTPAARTEELVGRIESAARAQPEIRQISSVVGERSDIETGATDAASGHIAQLFIELVYVEQRDRASGEVIDAIRAELAGVIDAAERISFEELTGGPGGPDISVRVTGRSSAQTGSASRQLMRELSQIENVYDVVDDQNRGQPELQVQLRPSAATLGLTVTSVARQVRGYLYGLDAHVFADRQEDVDVRVRVDEPTRRSLWAIETAWVITPTGRAVPLSEVADVDVTGTWATIKRVDRQRAITVTAETTSGISPEQVMANVDLDELRRQWPGVRFELAGRQQQQAEAFASLPWGFLAALLMIYVILAWLFASYVQPLVVLAVVPMAVVGVVLGHLFLGYQLTFLSLIGMVALSGIVVNDSLILVAFYNDRRKEGLSVHDALMAAGQARLRPILLTTITTVLGLTPLILEQSFQARFLIPMAIAIAAGLLSATFLILVTLPCLVRVLDDASERTHRLWYGVPRPEPSADEDDALAVV
ncbi:MAG: efflux RND transporter permease subunit [Phycisphaeraceae bacterium]|nr:efflux RND transporter permease subunit [Phycisphaeraceae bacterium]